jgi:hypothetical protein
MSSKTTFKRIALVAVAALTGGLLSVVATPAANAVPADKNVITSLSAGSVTSTYKIARVGQTFTQAVLVSSGSGASFVVGSNIAQINAMWTQVPAGDLYNSVSTSSGYVIAPTIAGQLTSALITGSAAAVTITDTQASGATPAKTVLTAGSATNSITGSVTKASIATVSFTPRVAGTYKVLLWSDDATSGNTDGTLDGAERSTTISIVAAGAPTAVKITSIASSVAGLAVGSSTYSNNEGAAYLVTLTDAAGNTTIPGVGEVIAVTASNGTASDASLTTADFNAAGQAFIQVYGGAKGLNTLTVTPGGALSSITAVTDSSVTFGTAPSVGGSKLYVANTTGVALGAGSALTSFTGASNTATFAVGTSLSMRAYAAAGEYTAVQITDTSGGLTARAGTTWSVPVTSGSSTGYGAFSVATTGISAGSAVVVTLSSAATATSHSVTFTAAASAIDAASTLTPAASSLVVAGGVTLTLTAVDQFGLPVVGAAVSWSRAGRNATTVSSANVTNADGIATYTYTDTSTSTTSLTDTVSAVASFNGASVTETATVTFGTSNAVGSLTVTASPTLTSGSATSAIDTSYLGADNTTATVSVTVKNAAGSLLAGVPVTWTTSNAKSGILVADGVNYATTYSDASGVATTKVYGWTAPGATTVTATAGTATATTIVNFVNAAADARAIAVKADGGLVSATVTDRFGNVVKTATVTWAVTGGAYFGNGTTGTTGTTDATGVAQIVVNGSGTVTASLDTATYTQAADVAGEVDGDTAEGVGATLSAAGVSTASVAVTGVDSGAQVAADAAAEATDAANAATDAANAAAEAADAATAAAQDAADAVAALSAQVATLISGLKAQLTALTNLVIKIQKKVKA